jgi:hypothetical protein
MFSNERIQEISEDTQREHFHDELNKVIDIYYDTIICEYENIYEMYEYNLITLEELYEPFQEFFGNCGIHHNHAKELILSWMEVTPPDEMVNLDISTKKDIVYRYNEIEGDDIL